MKQGYRIEVKYESGEVIELRDEADSDDKALEAARRVAPEIRESGVVSVEITNVYPLVRLFLH